MKSNSKRLGRNEARNKILNALRDGSKSGSELKQLFKNTSTYYHAINKLLDNKLIIEYQNPRLGRQYKEYLLAKMRPTVSYEEVKAYISFIKEDSPEITTRASDDLLQISRSKLLEPKTIRYIIKQLNKKEHKPILITILLQQYWCWKDGGIIYQVIESIFQKNLIIIAEQLALDINAPTEQRDQALQYLTQAELERDFSGQREVFEVAFEMASEESDAYEAISSPKKVLLNGFSANRLNRLRFYDLFKSKDPRIKKRGKELLDITSRMV